YGSERGLAFAYFIQSHRYQAAMQRCPRKDLQSLRMSKGILCRSSLRRIYDKYKEQIWNFKFCSTSGLISSTTSAAVKIRSTAAFMVSGMMLPVSRRHIRF